MDARSLQFVSAACAAELWTGSPATLIHRVVTDSRLVTAGDLFVALKGEHVDGHDFLPEVARKGAAAVLVERGRVLPDLGNCAVLAVDNPRQALGRLAGCYRESFSLPLVTVGGSNGKTTTKELVAAVLRQKLPTVWSEASYNNDLGVPLTLLKIESTHAVGVLEVGTNHPGELARLVRLVQPTYGIITSIGREHLEFFGDLSGVVQEEGSLAELLPPSGRLFLNGDSEWSDPLAQRSHAPVVRVGFRTGNDWRAQVVRLDQHGVTFQVDAPWAEYGGEYRVNLLGRHQVVNALLAVALGRELGLDRTQIRSGLAECRPQKMRLQLWEYNGVLVLDDAYNANADSMLAALLTLRELPCKGRRIAVLGDMGELGAHTEAAHEEVGRHAAQLGVGQLFAVGKMAPVLARGARSAGLNRIFEFLTVEAAAAAVRSFVKAGDVLLLKASRATRLEGVAMLLRGSEAGKRN